ncbi:sensor histidine kinase [Singulisphaera acidiphila]|uniref:histidine kinase n=1 Tax=Singulisphaera acidiphila (strain ATCC BAA-1392 / DSM 18658 / VKM B-2454 / MOB10) TaxID=886293 RepID=L0DI71_SINAD|nr:PAS domain-containing sensor histidine kinase [Singulisphaera acidiphila]AGA28508.1 PAS domain S-box [Singulisphaera acidiphila DSM 18658]
MPNAPDSDSVRPAGDTVFDRRDWLQITLSSIGDGVITADRDGRVNYLNPVAETLTGWTLADAAGVEVEQVFRVINETTREPVAQPVRKVIERGLTVGLGNHTLLIARDGSERPIDDSAAAIKDDHGDVVGVVLIFRDITERRQAELAIDSAKEYAESIVMTVREPLLVLDSQLHVRSANRSFYETFHVSPDETVGRYLYGLGDGQWDIPALRTLLEEILLRNPSFHDFEVSRDFEHIGPRTMLLNARRLQSGGRLELILLAIEDVTDRRRAEREVEESERRKDEFIAVLAHELRTPLSTISLATSLLQGMGSEEDRSWALGVVGHQVKNLNRLIEDLLDVSRISQGKIHLRKEVIDLAAVIARAEESVTAVVKEREHELTVSVPREPMVVEGDPTRLEQVFGNLLTNAAKYTAKGGRITVTGAVDGGDFVVRVRDTGEGISAEMMPGLFEMFTQVESSTHHSRGGLGIGLSLVRTLVEMHGGSVQVASDGTGLGSEFSVRLPALVQ